MYHSIGIPISAIDTPPSSRLVGITLGQVLGSEVTGLATTRKSLTANRLKKLAALLPEDRQPIAANAAPALDSPDLKDGLLAVKNLDGRPIDALRGAINDDGYDLLVMDAIQPGEDPRSGIGPLANRLLRTTAVDTLIVKESDQAVESDHILVCIDGSAQSFAGLQTALELGRRFGKRIECVGVYDPYIHYTLFNGIVNVLSKAASAVFKFKDQEKLHEEIIDTGLAKIYQAHLEVAREVAKEDGVDVDITLLDGKAFQKILRHAQRNRPWLVVMGRIGVHSGATSAMDIGSTTENLARTIPTSVLITSQEHVPRIDIQADASVQWVPEAKKKMERVPEFVRGVATTAILRWAVERGHSVITPSVINSAMGDLLPPDAAQAMGYVAEKLAIHKDRLAEGITFICTDCGHSVRDVKPAICGVCSGGEEGFERIDRKTINDLSKLDKGSLIEEETFDGKRLTWVSEAKQALRRVPSGYQRRRSKARIEKTARIRGITTISLDFTIDMIEQDLAETSYLSERGENLEIEVRTEERQEDTIALPREGSEHLFTAAAWKRLERVPEGFMREMSQAEVEAVARAKDMTEINLALCEEGLTEGRRIMAETLQERARELSAERARELSAKANTSP
jgi:nucleotide-binding universal stress UspA family protein